MMTHVNTCRRVAAYVFIGAFVAIAAGTRLEAQAVRATILGAVRDATGAAMPGATVEVRNVGTGVVQSVVTNEQGRYNAPDLAIGTYEVQASLSGFQRVVHKGITLRVGSQNVVDFTLPVGDCANRHGGSRDFSSGDAVDRLRCASGVEADYRSPNSSRWRPP